MRSQSMTHVASVPSPAGHTGHPAPSRAGISLFEVILSMVILATSLAAIGQLIYSGGQGAVKARLLTQAVFLAESKMGEIAGGAETLVSVADVPFPNEVGWTYSITVSSGPHTDLYNVTVDVNHTANSSMGKVHFDISRMVRDPGAVISARQAEAERQAQEDAAIAAESAASAVSTPSSGSSSSGASTTKARGR